MERLAEKFIDASIIYGEAIEQGESKAANKQSSIIRKVHFLFERVWYKNSKKLRKSIAWAVLFDKNKNCFCFARLF